MASTGSANRHVALDRRGQKHNLLIFLARLALGLLLERGGGPSPPRLGREELDSSLFTQEGGDTWLIYCRSFSFENQIVVLDILVWVSEIGAMSVARPTPKKVSLSITITSKVAACSNRAAKSTLLADRIAESEGRLAGRCRSGLRRQT